MILFRAAFTVFRICFITFGIDRIAVLVKGINIRMPDVEVVISTVEIGDGQVAAADILGFFIDPFLQCVLVFSDDIKSMVNIIESEPVKRLKEEVFAA